MGALTETEIFDCMRTSLKAAAECCDELARTPLKGPVYDRLRKELKLIEGCCRQASAWREDTRWLPIGLMMHEVHDKAGNWLRGWKHPENGQRIKFAEGQRNPLFVKLGENLRALSTVAENLRTKATGRVGMILPKPLPGPHRDTRPVGFRQSPSGLILPGAA